MSTTRFDPKQVAFGNLKNAALKGNRKNQQRLAFDVFTPTENASFEEGLDDSLLVGNSSSRSGRSSISTTPVSSIIDDIKNGRNVPSNSLDRFSSSVRNSLMTLGDSRGTLSAVIASVSATKRVSSEEALYYLINEDPQAIEAAKKSFGENLKLSSEELNKFIKILKAAANKLKNKETTNQIFKDLTIEEAKKIFLLLDEDVPEDKIESRLNSIDLTEVTISSAARSRANDDLLNSATVAVSSFGIGGVLSETIKESSDPEGMIETMFMKAIETSNPMLLKEAKQEAIKYNVPLKVMTHEQIGYQFKYQTSWYVYEFIRTYKHKPDLYKAANRDPSEYLNEVFSEFAYLDYIDLKEIQNRAIPLLSSSPRTFLDQRLSTSSLTFKQICYNVLRVDPLNSSDYPEDNILNQNRNLFYSGYLDIFFKRFNYQEFSLNKWYTALDTILSTFDPDWSANLDDNCQKLLDQGYTETLFDWRALFEAYFSSFNTTWKTHRVVTEQRITVEDNFFEYSGDYALLVNTVRATATYNREDDAITDTSAIEGALVHLKSTLK